MRRFALALLALLAVPAPALADVTLTEFKVEPSSPQAGGHPSVKITQAFSYSNTTDDAQDTFVRLAPGLLGNPQNAALCTSPTAGSRRGSGWRCRRCQVRPEHLSLSVDWGVV